MGFVPISSVTSRVCRVCVCVFRRGLVDGAGRHLAISLPFMCFASQRKITKQWFCALAWETSFSGVVSWLYDSFFLNDIP